MWATEKELDTMEWCLWNPWNPPCKQGTHQKAVTQHQKVTVSPQTPIPYHQLSLKACENPGGHTGTQGWAARAGLLLLLVKELVDHFDL